MALSAIRFPVRRGETEIMTVLATVTAAPVALAVRAFHGTASSPKTMGRVLVYLAMLSTVSAWSLPPPAPHHESIITGEIDGARDRRQLNQVGSSLHCDGGWSVPPRPAPGLFSLAEPCHYLCPQRRRCEYLFGEFGRVRL